MPLRLKSHVHNDKVVINKAYYADQISHLQNFSKSQTKQLFFKGLANVNKRDHRSYASVVQHSKGQNQFYQIQNITAIKLLLKQAVSICFQLCTIKSLAI